MSATYNTDKAALNHILAPIPNTNHCFLYYCPNLVFCRLPFVLIHTFFFSFPKPMGRFEFGPMWLFVELEESWLMG
ncbi:hypothetical protein JHK82_055920 [Glycine max]|uniref:Uncharacterized protein n=2 Tax=Glycine subgen. Soja TaxID=1462606 RepID=A0A0R0EK59_SOYBN|nr:hypothetical protein JHK86_055743 [Glycine max]KAG4909895.1 hypothetical protein JHK87_056011 [Glycine soja]KAG4918473.1 hypothetical protein JHK85_056754 [Glycine max]KAG5074554.1 hypothetical protein JHK84_055785 [Glycine max]KAG5077225.1 hypothetical protein JHK82_055920 [Glycine max]